MKNEEWRLVSKNGVYFAEKDITLPYTDIKRKVLFRDFNNEVLPLGTDKDYAEWWVKEKNEIDKLL